MSLSTIASIPDRLYTARNKLYVRLGNRLIPYYLVNEFPKSGGTWLSQMLASALELPFRRNDLVRFEPSIVHGHYLNPALLRNVVIIWRDPRDLIVSFYYHSYYVAEFNDRKFGNKHLVTLMKERCPFSDYEDIRSNLPRFIDFISTDPVAPRYTWPDFVYRWAHRDDVVQTRYEALRADTTGELARIVQGLTGNHLAPERASEIAERYSFARAKARAEAEHYPGAEKSFVREGSLGGWRRHFTPVAEQRLEQFGYLDALKRLGYPTS